MKYNLAFKYRIYPNKEQELLINKTFGCVRFVYNTILYTANKFYEETGKNKIITPASLKSENQFLKEVDSLALSNAQLNVKRSFTNFFQKRAKFPRFKSKKNNVKSYTTNCVNNSIRIEENKYLVLPKLKRIKLKYHREIPKNYRIKSVTLINSNGNYYVSILTEFEKEVQKIVSAFSSKKTLIFLSIFAHCFSISSRISILSTDSIQSAIFTAFFTLFD